MGKERRALRISICCEYVTGVCGGNVSEIPAACLPVSLTRARCN